MFIADLVTCRKDTSITVACNAISYVPCNGVIQLLLFSCAFLSINDLCSYNVNLKCTVLKPGSLYNYFGDDES